MTIWPYILLVCYLPIIKLILPHTSFGAGIPDIGPQRLLIYLLFFAFTVEYAVLKYNLNIFSNWLKILFFYLGIVILSVSWSNYSYGSFTLQQIFGSVLIPIFVAFVALNIFTRQNCTKLYITHIVVISTILSVMSIYQMFVAIWLQQETFRARGTFATSNELAIFLILSLPCIMYASEKRIIPKFVRWIAFSLVPIGIMATVSRKGIVTMTLSFCLYNVLKKRYKLVIILLVLFAFLVSLFFGYSFFSKRFSTSELGRAFNDKWNMTVAGWEMFKTKPLIGLGYSGYFDNYGKFMSYAYKEHYDAHNIFITALANYGLVGFVPFVLILVYPIFISVKILRKNEALMSNEYSRDMATVCLSSIIPFIVAGWYAGGLFYHSLIVSLLYSNISLLLCRDN